MPGTGTEIGTPDDEIGSTIARLRGGYFEGRQAVERALLGHGAPLVLRLLELADDEGEFPYDFKNWLEEIDGASEVLLRVRREGPGRLRRYALEGLAGIGAGYRLDERDRRAIERLVGIKNRVKEPHLPEEPERWPGSWIAVRGGSLAAIAGALGLHHLLPATIRAGVHAACFEEHAIEFTDSAGKPAKALRVFVSPDLDGWRIVFLGWDALGLLREWTIALSRVCEEAQAYYTDDYEVSDNFWGVARDGVFQRAYRLGTQPDWHGEPLPFEDQLAEGDDLLDPTTVARHIGTEPSEVVFAEDVSDGRLATTHPEATPWQFKGAIPI